MPPRPSLTSTFSVSEANNEVVCPLRNNDGSACRKRCLGEKRYRSMQEHIRRAHPEHYISKLPATEESFALMVNTPPSERPPQPPPPPPPPPHHQAPAGPSGYGADGHAYYAEENHFVSPRTSDEYRRGSLLPAASAAAALAQLHRNKPEFDWESEQEAYSEAEAFDQRRKAHFAAIDPSLEDHYPPTSAPSQSQRELLPSSLARTPSGRSSTLPPNSRALKPNRPRKSSVTQNARMPKHERRKSKENRLSYDRKAYSAEPTTAAAMLGKRWEDLIDAAASATEEDERDNTPVPTSPQLRNRASVPPFAAASHMQSYTASPLQSQLTPPPPDSAGDLAPFPSVESSVDSAASGSNFHIGSTGLSDSSPSYRDPAAVQIYCAGCGRSAYLRESFACTECICGLCPVCVDALVSEQARGRRVCCPKCHAIGGKFKPFQLDVR